MTSTPELAWDTSTCADSALLEVLPFEPPGLPAGGTMRVLRRRDDGVLRSLVVELPAGWSTPAVACSADVQLYVLDGDLVIGDDRLAADSFAFHPAGSDWGAVAAGAGVRAIMIFGGEARFVPATGSRSERAIGNLHAPSVDWIIGTIEGKPSGIKRKVLWEDPATGADTRLLVVPAGFEGRGPNYHPCHEEIFCLEGDIGPDDVRLMRPGFYLHNPAYAVHGFHEHSIGGAVVLEWHDARWSFNFAPQR
jgi:hypothetical protein